jgi:hypothetical protein
MIYHIANLLFTRVPFENTKLMRTYLDSVMNSTVNLN